MFRRRPLARAAVVGGAAYYAGKKGAQSAQNEAAEQQAAAEPEPAPAPAESGMSDDSMERLQKLADLHTQGVLTDAEFEVQKEKILQGM
jgi:hypothetical protein